MNLQNGETSSEVKHSIFAVISPRSPPPPPSPPGRPQPLFQAKVRTSASCASHAHLSPPAPAHPLPRPSTLGFLGASVERKAAEPRGSERKTSPQTVVTSKDGRRRQNQLFSISLSAASIRFPRCRAEAHLPRRPRAWCNTSSISGAGPLTPPPTWASFRACSWLPRGGLVHSQG